MKKYFLFIAVIAVVAGCTKKESNQDDFDKWNGYEEFYKAGEMYKDLKIRGGGVVGTVTYGIDDNANFYVEYQTDGDWELVKTFMYAGKWKQMPKRRRSKPKISNFPYKDGHNPYVSTYLYTIPLVDLPTAESPGFVVAAGARVYNSNKCGGGDQYTYKKAWAEWDRRFSCRTWGGYSNYYYNQPFEPHTLLYGTSYRNDSLSMFLIDGTDGTVDLIATEYVGSPPSESYDGTALNSSTNQFFFTNYNLQELWVNNMDSTESYKVGDLDGIAASATFYDGSFFYVDENSNQIMEVSLAGSDSLYIVSESVFSTIPNSIEVNDIAFEPNGDHLYIVGEYNNEMQLLELEVATDAYSSTDINVASNAQIAYGDDNILYAVETDPVGIVTISSIDPGSGNIEQIDDNDIEVVDPFADLASGPVK